ncbi:ABC transporter permease [Shouchella shacheensis]|uniref:ABC transporter permease n=1 Tax=Shouchella shacheensis TaxID=1649580 RepID=UPI00074020AB|nr:ABC transporter permease subunit [Shouchella shacheensis]
MRLFKRTSGNVWGLFPALFFIIVFVGYGLMMALQGSITTEEGGWSLEPYRLLLAEQGFRDSLVFSLRVTILSTLISLVVGLLLTRFLFYTIRVQHQRWLVWLPLLFPHFVAGYMVVLLFSQSGWFSSLAYQLGLISDLADFPIWTMDRHGIGIILTYLWKEIPFVILMLLPVYMQLDRRYVDVVHTLGGSRLAAFWTVEWRALFPVLIETGLILFAFIFAAFEVPYLLGVTYPKMLPVLSYQWFFDGNWEERPLALAAMILVTAVILVIALLALAFMQRGRFRMTRGGE